LGSAGRPTNRAICELVRLAARLIIEEGLEREATHALDEAITRAALRESGHGWPIYEYTH